MVNNFRDCGIAISGCSDSIAPKKSACKYYKWYQKHDKLIVTFIILELWGELDLPKHGRDRLTVNSKKYTDKRDDVAIDLIFCYFDVIYVIIYYTHKDRAHRAYGMHYI